MHATVQSKLGLLGFITINDNDKKTVMYLKFHHCVCLQIFATHPSAEHRIRTVAQSEGLSVTWQEGDPCTNLGPPLFEWSSVRHSTWRNKSRKTAFLLIIDIYTAKSLQHLSSFQILYQIDFIPDRFFIDERQRGATLQEQENVIC